MNRSLLLIVLSLFFLTGCFFETPLSDLELVANDETVEINETVNNKTTIDDETIQNVTAVPEEISEQTPEIVGCIQNSECEWDEQCIDGNCGKISELYKTEGCDIKCNFNDIIIETSDGDSFTLSRGKGDYTGGGAVEWVVSSGPDYCQGEEIILPVKIMKKSSGKIITEEYLTVGVGEESSIITHPTASKIKFTFEVKSVEETCG
tara:strand:+ start:195 stop:812 length:618 start_codon:yes stop_codon:yes gene_type:complete